MADIGTCSICKQRVPVRENGEFVDHFSIKSERGRKIKTKCSGSSKLYADTTRK